MQILVKNLKFVSDNMPFNSFEIRNFANSYEFNLVTSSPYYPWLVRQNELYRYVDDESDLKIALLEFRNTPIIKLNLSRIQLLFGRRTKTKIPIHSKLLKPTQNLTQAHKQILWKSRLF